MARVFISHAAQDGALAADLHGRLTADGHEVFLDQDLRDGLAGGEEWESRLYERLRWADAVVCLVTATYRSSVWCAAEAAVARSRGSRLIPLMFEPGVDHPLLKSIHHIDCAGDPAAARSALKEALRRVDAAGGLGWPDGRSPFPGLLPFDTDLHRAFFGRTGEVEALAALLRSPATRADGGLLLVVGPSGCGKSSLVRAGLLPVMAGEPDWLTLAPFFTGHDPLLAMAGELAHSGRQLGTRWTPAQVRERLAGDGGLAGVAEELLLAASVGRRRRHLLMVVDQLEELLTQVTPACRAAFAGVLSPALARPVQVVATIRPESLPGLLASEELAGLPVRTFALRPLRRQALPEVIQGPSLLAGFGLEEHLLDRLVADTGSGEALPLLAFTLAELAAGVRRGGQLSMRRYQELGGVQGALQRQADAALAAALAASGRREQDVIAGLLRLVTVDERGDPTRWRAGRDEMSEPVRAELDAFVTRRLLTTDADETGSALIGVAHEAFLSAWPPLARAIAAAASGLRARQAVEQAAGEWDRSGRPPRRLWEGNQLARAVDATGAHLRRAHRRGARAPAGRRPLVPWPVGGQELVTDRVELSPRATDFLRSSVRRDRGRRRRFASILAVLLTAAIAAASAAFAQSGDARRQQRLATARELIVEAGALRASQPRVSLLLSVEALRLDPTGDARAGLLDSLIRSSYAGILRGHTGPVTALAFSPDGHTAATAGDDGTAILWDTADRLRLATLRGHAGPVTAVAFSPDGTSLATGGSDGTATLWDVTSRSLPRSLATLGGHTGAVTTLAFSPDGRALATASDEQTTVWDVSGRARPLLPSPLVDHTGPVTAVAFSPDGGSIAIAAGTDTLVWHLAGGAADPSPIAIHGHADTVTSVAFSPDGHTLATASYDHTAILWDLSDRSLAKVQARIRGHTDVVYAVAFSPDGRTLATASGAGTATLWDVTTRSLPRSLATLGGHTGAVTTLAFSPDGHTLATAGDDGTAILWDLTDRHLPRALPPLGGHTDLVSAVAFSPDGHTLATASYDGTAVLWDLAGPSNARLLRTLDRHAGPVVAAAFSPDGRTLATGGWDKAAVLWDLTGRSEPAPAAVFFGHARFVTAVAFSPDGRTLATASDDGTAILWDVTDRAHPGPLASLTGHSGPVTAVAFSPDGHTLATASDDGTAILWDVTTPARRARLATLRGHSGPVSAVAFSPGGRILATADDDGTAILWDLRDRARPARLATLGGHSGPVYAVAFSPDGRALATAGDDHTAILWDLSDRSHPVRLATLDGHTGPVSAVAFSPDGHILATASDDRTAILWELGDITSLGGHAVATACAMAGPALSRDEWARYVPGMPFERTCP